MATVVGICNRALLRLGHSRQISSLDPKLSAEAEYCSALYDDARRTVLRLHAWNFATRVGTLALTTEASDEYDYVYQLPSKCVRVVKLVNLYGTDRIPFVVRGKRLYTDAEEAKVQYVYDEDDPNMFDDEFTDALTYLLASELAGPLTQDDNKRVSLYQLFTAVVSRAAGIDAEEQQIDDGTTYLKARL